MREREGKVREEILNEDGRETGWMKEIWKRRERIEKERGEDRRLFLELLFCLVMFMCIYLNCKKKMWSSRSSLFFINAVHLLNNSL
jgi:hypothetical protein